LLLQPASVLAGPTRQPDPTHQYTVADCQQADPDQLRDEIEAQVLAVLQGSAAPLDVDSLVARKWAELGMDAIVDAEVARAVNDLYGQEDYLNRFISGWWGEKAQEYAERIAAAAFDSPTFRVAMDKLSAAIGAEVAQQVQAQFAQAASVGLLCLQAYVGEQYAQSLFTTFQTRVELETQQLDLAQTQAPQFDAVEQHQFALAGVSTILLTQLTYRLAQKLSQKIAQRVAGKVVGRVLGKAGSALIPVAGWIVGLGLIVYDLWEGGYGALPQIQESLQSEEVKARIRDEIATAVRDDLPDQAALIALETAASLTEQWQGFCDEYSGVCRLAEENPEFRTLLRLTPLDELDRMAALVALFDAELGRTALDAALADGSFDRLLALPAAAQTILRDTRNPAVVLAWADLAGAALPAVAELGLHRLADPADFTPESLAALLAQDPTVEQVILAMTPEKRATLLALPTGVLNDLARLEAAVDLDWLAGYLAATDQPAAAVAQQVAAGAVTVEELRSPASALQAVGPLAAESPTPSSAGKAEPAAGELQQPPGGGSIANPNLLVLLLLMAGGAGVLVAMRRRR
jgi:hypothetical protein